MAHGRCGKSTSHHKCGANFFAESVYFTHISYLDIAYSVLKP